MSDKKVLNVLVTGAAGNIAYSLIPILTSSTIIIKRLSFWPRCLFKYLFK